MTLPGVPNTVFTERAGVLHLAMLVNHARCLWRETPMHDVGIDGHIEYVDAKGQATGRTVAVQVKSGESYFGNSDGDFVYYGPTLRHRSYWEQYPLPVVLVLHRPTDGLTVWADARGDLRGDVKGSIRLPLRRNLSSESIGRILELAGPLPEEPLPLIDLLRQLVEEQCSAGLTFFDLFVNGVTDGGFCMYFGMDLYVYLVEASLGYISISATDHEFIATYIRFLVAHDLARIDFDWFLRQERDMNLVGQVLAPLTSRGRGLLNLLAELDARQDPRPRGPNELVVVERLVEMLYRDEPLRLPRIAEFRAVLPDLLGDEQRGR